MKLLLATLSGVAALSLAACDSGTSETASSNLEEQADDFGQSAEAFGDAVENAASNAMGHIENGAHDLGNSVDSAADEVTH